MSISIISKKKLLDFDKFVLNEPFLLRFVFDLVATDGEESVGCALMTLFWNHEHDVVLLTTNCIPKEVERTDDEGLLFRGNSIFIYMMTEYVRLNGFPYLRKVLTPAIKFYLTKTNLNYEVDQTRLSATDDVMKNARNLTGASQYMLDIILNAVDEVPSPIREACQKIYQAVEQKFPGSGKRVICSLFFLRFLCPCIVSPKMYGVITDEKGQTKENLRGLILVAKLFQNIANELPPVDKYPQTAILSEFVSRNIPRVQAFAETILKSNSHKKPKLKRKSTSPESTMVLCRWLRQNLPELREQSAQRPAEMPPAQLARLEQLLDSLLPRPVPKAAPASTSAASNVPASAAIHVSGKTPNKLVSSARNTLPSDELDRDSCTPPRSGSANDVVRVDEDSESRSSSVDHLDAASP